MYLFQINLLGFCYIEIFLAAAKMIFSPAKALFHQFCKRTGNCTCDRGSEQSPSLTWVFSILRTVSALSLKSKTTDSLLYSQVRKTNSMFHVMQSCCMLKIFFSDIPFGFVMLNIRKYGLGQNTILKLLGTSLECSTYNMLLNIIITFRKHSPRFFL